ncbi:uncharacterized protein LOC108093384 [Drosophila ficusphila]|uniref:uncharacterized protein LOC108093384 n=1 Tax=Drosophila ficusphila TaxID=30025 RepID=UPI0007E63F75|nr:uncharacterized protein LOC108093384 [Drosophila ficusphila]
MRVLGVAIFLAALCALSAAEQSSSGKNKKESGFSKIVPRLLWNLKRGDNQESHRNSQQPIIIVQQPSSNPDRDADRHHHHHNPYNPYYPYYPPPPPPSRPPPPFPGMEYMNSAGGGPTYLIINPNNMQGIYLPSSNSSNSTSSRRSAFVPSITDLLQGLSLEDLAEGSLFDSDDSEVVSAAEDPAEEVPVAVAEGSDEREEDVISEEEAEALERQTRRGLSPKHLVSILMQDKRRRRIQEVLAGIYLRNYNLDRK